MAMTMMKVALASALTAFLLGVACSDDEHSHDDDGHGHGGSNGGGLAPRCKTIVDACHYKDDGNPSDINSCHSVAHAGVAAECDQVEMEKGCLALCAAAPDVHDSGVTEAGEI